MAEEEDFSGYVEDKESFHEPLSVFRLSEELLSYYCSLNESLVDLMKPCVFLMRQLLVTFSEDQNSAFDQEVTHKTDSRIIKNLQEQILISEKINSSLISQLRIVNSPDYIINIRTSGLGEKENELPEGNFSTSFQVVLVKKLKLVQAQFHTLSYKYEMSLQEIQALKKALIAQKVGYDKSMKNYRERTEKERQNLLHDFTKQLNEMKSKLIESNQDRKNGISRILKAEKLKWEEEHHNEMKIFRNQIMELALDKQILAFKLRLGKSEAKSKSEPKPAHNVEKATTAPVGTMTTAQTKSQQIQHSKTYTKHFEDINLQKDENQDDSNSQDRKHATQVLELKEKCNRLEDRNKTLEALLREKQKIFDERVEELRKNTTAMFKNLVQEKAYKSILH